MIFNILKKNLKYYAAIKNNSYKCKILIDDNSSMLELGERDLTVDDISVRSKYGTDLIYKLTAGAEEQENAGICSLKTSFYNKSLAETCRNLNGKWDKDEKVWIFSDLVEDEVEVLDEKYNSEVISIEVNFRGEVSTYCSALYIAGFKIAEATSRDSGAKLGTGICLIKGEIKSGGSSKNWKTVIPMGTIIRMKIPKNCFDDFVDAKNCFDDYDDNDDGRLSNIYVSQRGSSKL